MFPRTKRLMGRLALLGALAFVYFIIYPGDVPAVAAPVEGLVDVLHKVLSLTYAVSPWLYILASFAVLAWTALRIWGGRVGPRAAVAPVDNLPPG